MSHTTFTNGITLTDAAWFNDLDTVAYTYFGNGTNLNAPTKVAVTIGAFTTSVLTPIVDSNAASDLLLKRNGTTGITLGASSLVTLAGALTAGGTVTLGANTLALASATVSGTPTWSSNQAITLSTAAQGNVTSLGTLTSLTLSGAQSGGTTLSLAGPITLTTATSKIIPGVTSFSHRNNADNADNILIADNGNTTVRGTLTATGGFVGVSAITLGTEQASTSGTSIDFTSIPAGVKKISVMFNGVSTNGTSVILIQIGDSGGIETSGYNSGADNISAVTNSTAGFIVIPNNSAGQSRYGRVTLELENTANHTWTSQGGVFSDANILEHSAGVKSTSAELDRVRITTANGTDTFDAGAININYES